MSFETQRAKALDILAKTGIWESNYAPPALKLLWRLGFKVPPPHLANPWATALVLGVAFGILSGLVVWFFGRSAQALTAIWEAIVAGALFSFLMSLYYAYGRRKYNLPSWRSLADDATRT